MKVDLAHDIDIEEALDCLVTAVRERNGPRKIRNGLVGSQTAEGPRVGRSAECPQQPVTTVLARAILPASMQE